MTVDDWDRLLANQAGGCAICHVGQPVHVDHDHSTGALRGILCSACNLGLGQFADDPDRLRAAAAYLSGHRLIRLGNLQEFDLHDLCVIVDGRFHRAA